MIIMKANRIAQDGTPYFVASHLGLFCLPMSHKKDTTFMWVKSVFRNHRFQIEHVSSGCAGCDDDPLAIE